MTRTIARSIVLGALAVGAGWAQPLTVSCLPATLPSIVGSAVSVTCTASGGISPYTWSIDAGGALPPGLLQNTATGDITGILKDPAGFYSFSVVATDSTSATGSQSYSGTTTDYTVKCPAAGPLEVGVLYTNSCKAEGGTPPYSWAIVGTNVPPLMQAAITPTGNPATINYTPGTAQAYQYSVVATDSSTPAVKRAQQFIGAIAPAVAIGTTAPLPPGAVGSSYSQQFAVVTGSGVPPYGWTATGLAGTGLTMSATGLLAGTPASAGPVNFMAIVTDAAGGTSTGPFSLTVTPALAITTSSPLPAATVGAAYTQSFAATGGSGSGYTWSAAGLPAWLAMSSGGVLSGQPPSTAVTSTFTVQVIDSNSNSTSGSFTLPVTLAITTASPLPPATIGQAYNQTLTAVGGTGGYTWSGTNLPPWLNLSAAGALAGTPPPKAVQVSFSVTVTDSSTASVSAPLGLPITFEITTQSPLPAATIGMAYSETFAAGGGTGGYTWSATGLPAWLALSAAGVLTSTAIVPATALDAAFTVKVTDSSNGSVSGSFTVPVTLSITTASPLLPAIVNTSYSATFAASGGSGGYTWSATGLPAWATLNAAGILSGTPTTLGQINFNVTVTDSSTATQTSPFTLQVNLPPLTIATSSPLASGAINAAYNQTLTGTGGAPPYTWSVATGPASLPGGLTLISSATIGTISGTPATAGTFPFTIELKDSATPAITVTKPFVITIGAGLTITTTPTLPNATVGVAYSQTLGAVGGTTPYTWAVTIGSLPAPLLLNPSTGAITGAPAATGTANFTVTVTDSAGSPPASQAFTLTVVAPPVITTASPLPNGTAGAAYSQTLAASGGTQPYKWTVSSGSLPGGLSLSTAGAFTGMPNGTGTANFTVLLTDATGVTASKAFTLAIVTGVTISTTSPLPAGEATIAYSQAFAATGGVAPYVWVVTGGNLPPGLTLAANGSLTGTPGTAGTFDFTVQATDSNHTTASAAFALTIAAALSISTPATLSGGSVNSSYSQTLAASAGVSPYTWTLTTGPLPAGLSLSTAGIVAGVPSQTGTFPFTAKVTDSLGATASRQFTIVVVTGLTITTPPTLPGATFGVAYSDVLQAAGGTQPYTWTNPGGSLPPGLSLATSGNLTGIPTKTGPSSFTAQVTDGLGNHVSKQLTITVAPVLNITTSALSGGRVGSVYSQTLAATGGSQPYTWSIASGSLPGGLNLSAAGSITGTANAAGTFTFTVRVTDNAAATATKQLSITVAGGLSITTTSLPGGKVGTSYSQTLAAAGGSPPYTFTTSAGSLPPGITLNGAVLGGTPTKAGSYTFTIQVTDSVSATATQQFTITITGLAITTSALPDGKVGTSYSQTLAAAGGSPPYTFTTSAGSLPPGITLNGAVLSGTPTKAGPYTFTIQVTDSVSATATQQFTITIATAGLTITPTSLPDGKVGTSYSQTLAASGGSPPYTITTSAGSLPPGITLNGAVMVGTPTKAGPYTFTIQVTDSVSATATQQFTITIATAGLTITTSGLATAAVDTAYSQAMAADGGTPPYSWTVTAGALPDGLSLASNGTITGKPTARGSSNMTIQVADSTHATASAAFTLTVISASFSGLSSTAASMEQPSFTLALDAAYPQEITGQVALAFQPDASLASAADDPSIQFSTSGRTANFTIPANSTTAVPFSLQTGSVAGTITLTVSWQAGGATLPSPAALTQAIRIATAAPVISAVAASTTSSGFQVVITGYSNTRDVSQALVQFTAAAGQTLQTTSLTVSLNNAATTWFQSSPSDQYGSQFILTLPFTVSNGSASAIASISVQLVNSQGTSTAANATL